MKATVYIVLGVFFGIVMSKSEAISWYRIQEMFRFQSFHMYGIIGSALVLGIILIQIIKRYNINSVEGVAMNLAPKEFSVARYLLGGTFFGLGWALTGACPGPIFVLIGQGYLAFLVVLLSAVLGTFVYGLVRERLPH